MTYTRLAVLLAILAASVFGGVTLAALEGREVVVLHTFDAHGTSRKTRTWVADDAGYVWVEAANESRPFLHNIQANPDVELHRGGAMQRCRAVAMANPDGHERIRRLLAQKYGWADRWVGLLTDTSGSMAVRLECR